MQSSQHKYKPAEKQARPMIAELNLNLRDLHRMVEVWWVALFSGIHYLYAIRPHVETVSLYAIYLATMLYGGSQCSSMIP